MLYAEVQVEFAGLVHDHFSPPPQPQTSGPQSRQESAVLQQQNTSKANKPAKHASGCLSELQQSSVAGKLSKETQNGATNLSTIAILRRYPMHDSLVLVKRYRACLNGHSLEFPTSCPSVGASKKAAGALRENSQQTNEEIIKTNRTNARHGNSDDCGKTKLVSVLLDGDDPMYQLQEKRSENELKLNEADEIVHVPINGLLDRLNNYDSQGIAIDSRVYAFAMGFKTAEKFLTNNSMKEVQETPPL